MALLLVLTVVCFWVLSYSSWLSLPSWRGEIWFYVALVVPVAWQLLVRARTLNSGSGDARAATTLGSIGLVGLVLAVVAHRAMTAEITPTKPYGDTIFAYATSFGVRYWLVAFGFVAVVDRVLEMAGNRERPARR